MANDIFAPPKEHEVADLFAPPKDHELAGHSDVPRETDPSIGGSLARHTGNSVSMGMLPQLTGGVSALVKKYLEMKGAPEAQFMPGYTQSRDEVVNDLKRDEDVNPTASASGKAIGSTVAGIGLGGMIPAGPGMAGRLLSGVVGTAATNLLQNPGDKPGVVDPLQLGERASRANEGLLDSAKYGAYAEMVPPIASKGFEKLGEVLQPLAKRQDKRANQAAYEMLQGKLAPTERHLADDKIQGIGQTLRDEELVKPFNSPTKLYNQLTKKTDQYGGEISNIIENRGGEETMNTSQFARQMKRELPKEVEALRTAPTGPNAFSRVKNYLNSNFMSGSKVPQHELDRIKSVAKGQLEDEFNDFQRQYAQNPKKAVENILGKDWERSAGGEGSLAQPLKEKLKDHFLNRLEEIESQFIPDKYADLRETWALRKGIDSDINYNQKRADFTHENDALFHVRNKLNDAMKEQAPELAPAFDKFHNLKSAEEIAEKEAARHMANQGLSLGDKVFGAPAAVAGLALGANKMPVEHAALLGATSLMAMGTNKMLRTYGRAMNATAQDKLAQMLHEAPEKLGSYAKILHNAYKQGPAAFNATSYLLMKNRDFRNKAGIKDEPLVSEKDAQNQFIQGNGGIVDGTQGTTPGAQ